MSQRITYAELLNTCQTGDLLLYNSRNHWYDKFIEGMTSSKFSHIGMLVKDPTFIDDGLKGVFILESGWENLKDVVDNKKILGVQLIPLEASVLKYKQSTKNGYLYYRALTCERNDSYYEKFLSAYKVAYEKPYDLLPQDWIKAEFDIEIGKVQRTETFWCSALVSYIYVKLGFLKSDLPWTLIAPNQYSFYEKKQLSFENCGLEPERCVKF